MLRLKRLEVEGFGPFADRQVLDFPDKRHVLYGRRTDQGFVALPRRALRVRPIHQPRRAPGLCVQAAAQHGHAADRADEGETESLHDQPLCTRIFTQATRTGH